MAKWSLIFALLFLPSDYALADLSQSEMSVRGNTDGTLIGNNSDRLKVDSAPAANVLSTVNSTTSTLGAAGVFTGTFEELLDYANVAITVRASHTGSLSVQWSTDGTNIDDTDVYTLSPDAGTSYTFGANSRYFRVVYTNGADAQSYFRLQSILHRVSGKPSSHRVEDSITGDNDSELVKAVLTVRTPSGVYRNVTGDDDGNLVVTSVAGFGSAFTFGDVASGSTAEKVVRRTAYTEQTTNAQRSFRSSDVDDLPGDTGARTLHITYYNQSGVGPMDEVITLNGTTCVATVATDIAFVEHIEVKTVGSSGANEGTISMFVNAACGGGTIGTINAGDKQTFWGHHYVPTGSIAHVIGISAGSTATTVGCGAAFILRAQKLDVADAVDIQVSDFVRLYGQSSTFARTYPSPIRVEGPARLALYVTPECSSSITYRASIDFSEF